ncbi:Plancitoxin-1, partial [Trichinella spiralis]
MILKRAILYKAPAQSRGMTLIAGGGAGNWVANPVDVTQMAAHSFGKVLEHVIAENAANKFIAYNNIPPDVPKVNTKSNSKGLLMMNPQPADEASWIVHTVPGFPKALRGYLFPPEEIQKGHLFICLTIKESEIDAIAEQINSRPNLKKLISDESRILPPLTVTQEISTAGPGGLKITIYSKGEKSRYEIYRRMLVKKLKTTIKVWTTRDKTLKSDCRIFGRNIRLVTSPIAVNGHANSLENDVSQWLKSQAKEPAIALCIDAEGIFARQKSVVVIVYKAPAQNVGKALIAGGGAVAWQNTPDLTGVAAHAVVKSLEHVIEANPGNKFIAYNNIPPDVPKVKTKSNSKGVLMMNPNVQDEASWIVHTVPGFPKALRGYVFPLAEIQKGHLFICLTIKESEIDGIAMALRIATPLIYHNDIPDAEIDSRPNLKKLVNAASRLTPPLTVTRQISTADAAGLKVTIYSKGEKSKYEIYRRVLVKKLKTGIKVWTTRDKTLKSDCRILGRSIKLVTSPITIGDHASSLESDVSHWLISDPGNKFCAVDKPYHKSQTKEPAIAVCIDDATIFGHFNLIGQNKSQTKEPAIAVCIDDATIFGHFNCNAPAQNRGKALIAGANPNAWQNTQDLTGPNGHAVVKSLEHVIMADAANKFIAYSNIPPDVPKVKTKSNSKGVLMMNPQALDEASWIVHTVPGFPKALRGYVFPPAEIQKGHLFICLTIKESEIDAIAMSLRIATPLIYHNDIPDDPVRPNLKKLVNGESRLTPPLTVTRQISTAAAPGLKVTIYSKGEKSKYEIYRKVLVKKLKTSIKVWTTRDKILKTDCRILNRNIKLVTSPITIGGHASSLESDVSQWLISEPGNKFCVIDKPYHKSQTKEPAMAVCIDDATIFGHFNMALRQLIAPAQNAGKALIAGGGAAAWQNIADLTRGAGHAVVKSLEHVNAANPENKFIAYNNIPPDVPKIKTKSNSKGVLMMNPRVADEASWIVHTVPGFPTALRVYAFPPAEIQKGHLFICLTVKESEIDAIAMTLRIATPLLYHNDIPENEINSRPNLQKLAEGRSRFMPPLTVAQEISTAGPGGLKVAIYSKSEKSRYDIYRRVLVKKLKASIKVWTTRDKTLKSDCRILNRNIKLVASPIAVDNQASSLESDVSQWLISEPGNKFCAIDKPYHKSQTKEPAMAVCIDDATIFGHFNRIGQNWEELQPAKMFNN